MYKALNVTVLLLSSTIFDKFDFCNSFHNVSCKCVVVLM